MARVIRKTEYKDMVAEFGQELAAALLEEEYNQYIGSFRQAPAEYYSFEKETFNEKLYRVEEEF